MSGASRGFAPRTPIRALPWIQWEALSAPRPPAVFDGAFSAVSFFAIMNSLGKLINCRRNILEKSLKNVFKIPCEPCKSKIHRLNFEGRDYKIE